MNIILRFCLIAFLLAFNLHSKAQPQWVISGAPIGDTSIFRYNVTSGLGANDSLTLKHGLGQDSLRLLNISGSPLGIHVYRVDTFPNVNCGLPGMLNNNRYFGLFVIGGTNPKYAVKYFFLGNPFVNGINMPFLQMFDRQSNSSTACQSWVNMNASMNLIGDSLSKPAMSTVQKEMILTFNSVILPVTLVQFDANWENPEHDRARIYWSVQSELNLHCYDIQKLNEMNEWYQIGTVEANGKKMYSFTDTRVSKINYYRLKCLDYSGSFEYSRAIVLADNKLEIIQSEFYPNPADDFIYLKINSGSDFGYCYRIISRSGQIVKDRNGTYRAGSEALKIPVSDLSSGTYSIELKVPAFSPNPFYKTIIKN